MRRFLAFIAVSAITIGSSMAWGMPQQAKPEQKPEIKTAANVAGKWLMTLELPMGTGTPTLDLKQEAEKVTGTYTGSYGTFPLAGTVKERNFEFAVTMTAEDMTFTLAFSGVVSEDGQTMQGSASLGELGEGSWSAKREKK
jgi:hypothetical protein